MSDQENTIKAEGTEESAELAEKPSEPLPVAGQAQRKSSSAIGWLALLLVLALAGGTGWLLPQLLQEKDMVASRLERLEASTNQRESTLDDVRADLQREISTGLESMEAQLQGDTGELSSVVTDMEAELSSLREELARFNAADRDSWLLAEVEYLLRLANQRLIMAGDTDAAKALLSSADKVVREINDTRLHTVRAAIAADLAAVRAVPTIDVEGIYLRLSALAEQADQLVIFAMPEQEARIAPEPAEDWQGRLRQGYEAAWEKLTDYIVIRRRDVPMQALMDPQWEGLVRQNLRMLLEQAQVALLSGNQTLYRESLDRAGQWVAQFRDSDEVGAGALGAEIDQLSTLQVAVEVPEISRSLRALDEALKQRSEGE